MSPTFGCPRCGEIRGRSQLIEVRRESRDHNQQRRHVVLLEKICRSCDDAEVERLRPRNALEAVPQGLFDGRST